MIALKSIHLGSDEAELIRQNHEQAIKELQQQPAIGMASLGDVSLPNGQTVQIAHKLGRVPTFVWTSPIKTAGVTAGTLVDVGAILGVDRTKYIALQANGFGATIVVTVAVM